MLKFQKEIFESGKYFLGVLWTLSSICWAINVAAKIVTKIKKSEN